MLLPPVSAVSVFVDGRHVRAYTGAFEIGGHVFASIRPYVTQVADRIWYSGDRLAIERNGRIVYIRMARRAPDALDRAFVPLRAIMVALGAEVRYDALTRIVNVRLTRTARVASSAPFDPRAGSVAPNPVFTPVPVPTDRPPYVGPPLPRRTPLPFFEPTPQPTPRPMAPTSYL